MRGTNEKKKKVKGWSTEEMKDKPRISLEEDAGEMIEWRSMSQDEMDQCWKQLTEKIEEEVLDKYKVEDSFFGMEACAKKQNKYRIKNVRIFA